MTKPTDEALKQRAVEIVTVEHGAGSGFCAVAINGARVTCYGSQQYNEEHVNHDRALLIATVQLVEERQRLRRDARPAPEHAPGKCGVASCSVCGVDVGGTMGEAAEDAMRHIPAAPERAEAGTFPRAPGDDEEREAVVRARVADRDCEAEGAGYCTRPPRHDGDHIAGHSEVGVLARWPSIAPQPQRDGRPMLTEWRDSGPAHSKRARVDGKDDYALVANAAPGRWWVQDGKDCAEEGTALTLADAKYAADNSDARKRLFAFPVAPSTPQPVADPDEARAEIARILGLFAADHDGPRDLDGAIDAILAVVAAPDGPVHGTEWTHEETAALTPAQIDRLAQVGANADPSVEVADEDRAGCVRYALKHCPHPISVSRVWDDAVRAAASDLRARRRPVQAPDVGEVVDVLRDASDALARQLTALHERLDRARTTVEQLANERDLAQRNSEDRERLARELDAAHRHLDGMSEEQRNAGRLIDGLRAEPARRDAQWTRGLRLLSAHLLDELKACSVDGDVAFGVNIKLGAFASAMMTGADDEHDEPWLCQIIEEAKAPAALATPETQATAADKAGGE